MISRAQPRPGGPRVVFTAILIAGFGLARVAGDTSVAQIEGQALAHELLGLKPAQDLEVSGTMRLRDATGNRREARLRFQVINGTNGWQSVYQVLALPPAASTRLTIIHEDQRPTQYWLTVGDPAGLAQSVPPGDTMVPFADSDFWLADLGLEFLHWPDQSLVRKEMRRGRSCRVLESRNPHPGPNSYLRVLSWIDLETDSLIQAEAYDNHHQLLKEFYPNSVTKVNGRMELKDMEIRNVQRRSRTRIEFDFDQK
jgi:hypothetical protein